MKSACLRHTEIPGASKLFTDFLYRSDRVARFYTPVQTDADRYEAVAAQLDYPDERRSRLVEALRAQNGDSPQLELLARPGTVAVVTGQQAGLFTGPAYTIYKALTAARLAASLREQGINAVPVFWLATEDHDAEEVNHCHVFDRGLSPTTLRVDTSAHNQRPVGTIPLGPAPFAGLRTALRETPFGDDVISVVEQCYSGEQTLGTAFRALLQRLLASLGLVYLDPLDPAIRRISAPLMETAYSRMPELVAAVLERGNELEGAGYHAQVHVEPKSSFLFLLDGGKRLPIGSRKPTSAEQLSGNALLRPVQQDYLLPTVAFVGGPAEIAYMAQSQVLYTRLLGRMPVVTPRNGFTLLDNRATKLTGRYQVGVPSTFHGREAFLDKVAAHLVPGGVDQSFQSARQSVTSSLETLGEALTTFDPTLADALGKSRPKILYQLDKLQRKAAREAMRRDQRAAAEADYLLNLIYPAKHLQERYYTILPFLAHHGLDLVGRLYDNVHLDCPDHVVLPI